MESEQEHLLSIVHTQKSHELLYYVMALGWRFRLLFCFAAKLAGRKEYMMMRVWVK